MTPFHPAFRRLLRQFIPQLKNDDLNRHESLTALRLHLLLKSDMQPPRIGTPGVASGSGGGAGSGGRKRIVVPPPPGLASDIDAAAKEANAILAPYKREYEAAVRLWIARRRLALQQGRFFQIPLNGREAKLLAGAIANYWRANGKTLPVLIANRVKYSLQNISIVQIIFIIALVALSYYGACSEAKLPIPDVLR
jgi:hypothetical protein